MAIRHNQRLFEIINELMSVLLSFAIVCFCISIVFLSCFRADGFVEKKFQAYNTQTVQAVNDRLEKISKDTGVPAEVYTSCFDEETANMILTKIVDNISFTYSTVFSDDIEIYNHFKAGITSYCYKNNIDLSNQEISANASLAVDAINEVLGGSSTAKIQIMKLVRGRRMMYVLLVSFFAIIGALTVIYFLNRGNHRRLNYYGMGVTSAGMILLLSGLFILLKNYSNDFKFCENKIYDSAVADITDFSVFVCMVAGIPLILLGFVLLFKNYYYFKTKQSNKKAIFEHNSKMRNEYMEEYIQVKRSLKQEITEDEIVSKIDFD